MTITRRTILPLGLTAIILTLTACGGGGSGNDGNTSAGVSSKAESSLSSVSSNNISSSSSSSVVTTSSSSGNSSSADATPAAFSIPSTTDAALSTAITSGAITLSGFDVAVPVNITNGEYSIDGGAFTAAAGTITPEQTIAVKVVSSNANSTAVDAVLTIGGVSATYSVTTLADAIPNAFTFTPKVNAALGSTNTSNKVTVGGIEVAVPIAITGGEYSINGGAFTAAAGTVTNGQTIAVKAIAPAGTELTQSAVVTIGGVSGTYSVTTIPDTTAPVAAFKFPTPYTMSEATSVKVRGTATDEHAITSVKVVVRSFNIATPDVTIASTEVAATPKAEGDYSSWAADVPLTANSENEIKVVATDDRNNSIVADTANKVVIRQTDVASAFPDEVNQFDYIFQGLILDATDARNRLLVTENHNVFSVDVKTGQRLKFIEDADQLMSVVLDSAQDKLYASSENSIIEYVLSSGERINKYTADLLSNIHVMTFDAKNDDKSIVGVEYIYGGEGANVARFSLQTKEFNVISSDNLEPKIIASEGIALDSTHNRFLVSSGGQSQENDLHAVIAVDYNSGVHSVFSSNSVGQGEGFIGLLPNTREAGLFNLAVGENNLYLAEYPNKIFKIDLENGNRSIVDSITYKNATESYQLQVAYGAMQYEEKSKVLYAIENFRSAIFVIDTETNERVILSKSKNNY